MRPILTPKLSDIDTALEIFNHVAVFGEPLERVHGSIQDYMLGVVDNQY